MFVPLVTDVFEFAATGTSVAGGASAGASVALWRTETFPLKAGIEINSAVSIKTTAATIVNFESTDAVPLGPKAALETLLVKSAPASVLPGCRSTAATRTMQEIKKIAYKTYNNAFSVQLFIIYDRCECFRVEACTAYQSTVDIFPAH